jgi:hypothetical protein
MIARRVASQGCKTVTLSGVSANGLLSLRHVATLGCNGKLSKRNRQTKESKMALTQQQKRILANRVKAHLVLLIESPDGLEDFFDEEGEVPQEVREQIGLWIARLPGGFWDTGCFGRRPR